MIRGKVAKIIDEYHLVINRGAKAGVRVGQKFVVYAEGPEIVDPDDPKKSLGKLEFPKGRVKVIDVTEEYAVAESDETYTVSSSLSVLMGNIEKTRPLRVKATEKTPPDGVIAVGDPVRETI